MVSGVKPEKLMRPVSEMYIDSSSVRPVSNDKPCIEGSPVQFRCGTRSSKGKPKFSKIGRLNSCKLAPIETMLSALSDLREVTFAAVKEPVTDWMPLRLMSPDAPVSMRMSPSYVAHCLIASASALVLIVLAPLHCAVIDVSWESTHS